MCIKTAMTYASHVFVYIAPKALDRLQVIQNKFCIDATDAHWCIRNSILHRDLELPTIAKFMKDASKRFFNIVETHPNVLLRILSVGYRIHSPIHLTLSQRQTASVPGRTNGPDPCRCPVISYADVIPYGIAHRACHALSATLCAIRPLSTIDLVMTATRAAGLVIFRKLNDFVEFLLLQTSYGIHHWTPPKGHVDPGESDWVTALRETKEEAGLSENDLEVYKNITKTLHYNVNDKPKVVVYWLAKLKAPNSAINLSDEHQDFKWLGLKEAQQLSGFEDMKQLLAEFHESAIKT
ncbi:Bis(5'-nucleosyl)-tetraphosphatase [Eumeta japonica]|uniref:Bis(5'-nucleosyl)-tetraphosphatase [asymmetrical] n=1 Tax=Eumeta variegata TaxID=151549 RepID=A0A4C1Y5J2_EUMVA|nr:Bis(5'-nucleosyl)-tetraphosphatase [Eumeta japonica]